MQNAMNDPSQMMRAILFADVCGSTRLYRRLGDLAARELIGSLLDELTEITRCNDGELVKTIGDELMGAFPSPATATRAACEMQLHTQKRRDDKPLSVRIGFHWGPVVPLKKDYLGDAVNLSARVAELATIERILTTHAVHDAVDAVAQQEMRWRGCTGIKGFETPVGIWEVLWRPATARSPDEFARNDFDFAYTHLRMQCRGTEYVISEGGEPLTIGRVPENRLAIDDDCVSSRHATIEMWGGQFMLVDMSLNGTHARYDGTLDSFRVPTELRLCKSGTLWFGRWPQDPQAVSATFVCERRQ